MKNYIFYPINLLIIVLFSNYKINCFVASEPQIINASEWENSWRNNAHDLVNANETTRDWRNGCDFLKKQEKQVDIWLDYWKVRENCTIKDNSNILNSVLQSSVTDADYINKQKSLINNIEEIIEENKNNENKINICYNLSIR